MKTLRRMKIINWHYFWNEMIDFGGINFLTGLNASGKSTLIDAMQVLLLGDTSGRYFNKAAMDKSNRTLKGYLRGELGDNLEGGFHYLRNGRFTSYIAMEFYDDKNDKLFTMGVVFDVFEDGEEDHRFFVLEAGFPANEFIVNDIPMDYKTLNTFFNTNYSEKFVFFDSNRQYQEKLKHTFGGLKDKYFSLLKKSVSFTPITDITTFITEYVCDPQQNVDIAPMQENILQYRKLEKEAQIMKERVTRLSSIQDTFSLYEKNRKEMAVFSYLIEKAGFQNDQNRLTSYLHQAEEAEKRLAGIDVDIAEAEHSVAELNRRKTHLIQDKANSDVFRIADELREQKDGAEKKLAELKLSEQTLKDNLSRYVSNFIAVSQALSDTLANFTDFQKSDPVLADEINGIRDAALTVLHLSMNLRDNYLGNLGELTMAILSEWRDALSDFKQKIALLAGGIGRMITSFDQKSALLKQQEIDLRNGGKPYEAHLVAIRRELEAELTRRHNHPIHVYIFADLFDIKHPEWVNAIEGYLNNQKFNFFVDEDYYMEAYEVIRQLLEKHNYYGLTLVDSARLIERNYQAEAGSLAEEIKTDHSGASAYANFLIGRLRKCKNINEARSSGNGITVDGDLYRSFAFGKINPRLYREHYIGRQISEEQLAGKRAEISENASLVSRLRELAGVISEANRLEIINTNEITAIAANLEKLGDMGGLIENISYLEQELSKHDLSQLESIDKRINDIDEDIRGLATDKDALNEEKGKTKNLLDNLRYEKIPAERASVDEKEAHLAENFDPFLVSEEAEPLYQNELSSGKSALEIITEYNVSFGHAQYLVNNLFSQLSKLRRDYVRDYRLSYDTDQTDNDAYAQELREMTEVRLPEYEAKIHDAYDKAVKQFKNDFISKLRNAIESVEDQISELNFALSASTFGDDSYRFTVRPSATYRTYYDMIMDDLLLEIGDDDAAFLAKYDNVMRDLFAQVALANDAGNNASVLANVEKFTDYRSYLDFDLVVKDKAGNEQRLSRMIKKKSGGETQTPFYIAVLASFAQLYHVNETGELGNTLRLIIFDEAFSKMDGGRIKESVRLLRKFGLQAIISAPSDKVAEISSLVDETLVVLRGRNASTVHLYAEADKLA